ncbi:MAG TPA: 3-deoxy-D-manno-octulosonic acid transferase [Thiothrix sp.]|nr:3-deoxy-D-manno-octulosonic acid transferase [Thiothrix sp.]
MHLAVPFALLRLGWRSRKNPAYRQRIAERFAFFPALDQHPRLCLHAVSVGEVIAAKPLISAILTHYPDYRLLVTTTTPTGSTTLKRLFANKVEHVYFPYDLPTVITRFLQRSQPRVVIIMETEIWPNFYRHCAKKNIPLILANARLSARSFQRYEALQPFTQHILQTIDTVAARDQQDVERFLQLGMNENNVQKTGNIKYDLQIPKTQITQGFAYRQAWGNRPIWLAASTHAGEDEILLTTHQQLLNDFPDLLLILVPRHPERSSTIATLIRTQGLNFTQRSLWQNPQTAVSNETSVVLADSLGEMFIWLKTADIAFIGGSLIERGGHNPLEAAALAKPIISGPFVFNFTDVFHTLMQANAAVLVDNPKALCKHVHQWLSNPSTAQLIGQNGQQVIEQHHNATQNIISLLQQTIAKLK